MSANSPMKLTLMQAFFFKTLRHFRPSRLSFLSRTEVNLLINQNLKGILKTRFLLVFLTS